jgi:formylglycine-generating enzyme required for sulfatase activity
VNNPTFSQWSSWAVSEKLDYAQQMSNKLGKEFSLVEEAPSTELPLFTHESTGLKFRLVPGGEFNFGLSVQEEAAARAIFDPPPLSINESRPVQKVMVKTFLMELTPMLWPECSKLLQEIKKPNYAKPYSPAWLERETCLRVGRILGCTLPTEKEWEYACRANSTTLFPWGDSLPDRKTLSFLLSTDFSSLRNSTPNAFGIHGIFTGEWCLDQYTESHDEGAKTVPGSYVVKGGGASWWPWQNHEWVWCVPAMRMPSSGLIDNECGFRFVFPVD